VSRWIAAASILLALFLAATHWLDQRSTRFSGAPRSFESDRRPGPSELHFGGLTYATTAGENRVEMRIGDLRLRDRKAGFFTLSAIKELELRDLAIRLHPCEEPACSSEEMGADTELPGSLEEALQQPIEDLGLGLVTRVRARQVAISWNDSEDATLMLYAGRLSYGLGSDEVRLGESIAATSSEGASLQARDASWDTKRAMLDVRGDYEWTDGRTLLQKGRDGSFSIDPETGIHQVTRAIR